MALYPAHGYASRNGYCHGSGGESLWLHQTALRLPVLYKRGHRMKVLVHDGLGIWLCARRLEQGKFHWAQVHQGETVALSPEQLQALIQGLPWQRIGLQQVVNML
ncbi:IS66 family insertion sequence element accessory protein TnpB [Acinetobacter sp. YH12243]|uniref:IS66 family insertion sequence element accessory protein TnpB n=1 Tax=Acinetobacter sp. YH12243 TaxID=2601169 RepID=UPI0015D2C158|nr:IS66 family insertion sequence element accessory protein TnpB [Acinetobacter sp. YH12243]